MNNALAITIPGGAALTKAVCEEAVHAVENNLAKYGADVYDNLVTGDALIKIGEGLKKRAADTLARSADAGHPIKAEHPSGTFAYVEGATTWQYDDDELRQIEAEIKANAAAQAEAVVKLKAEQAQLETRLAARQQYLVANGLANRVGQGKGSIRFTMAKGGGK